MIPTHCPHCQNLLFEHRSVHSFVKDMNVCMTKRCCDHCLGSSKDKAVDSFCPNFYASKFAVNISSYLRDDGYAYREERITFARFEIKDILVNVLYVSGKIQVFKKEVEFLHLLQIPKFDFSSAEALEKKINLLMAFS